MAQPEQAFQIEAALHAANPTAALGRLAEELSGVLDLSPLLLPQRKPSSSGKRGEHVCQWPHMSLNCGKHAADGCRQNRRLGPLNVPVQPNVSIVS